MRKQFLLTLILCLTSSMTWAERIDVATACKVAESVVRREGATSGLRSAGELPLVYAAAPGQSGSALRSGAMEGAADYFVFNFPGGKGFAIVAGDDRVRPVLGYSDEGSFDPDNLPENLRGWLAGYREQIDWAVDQGTEVSPSLAAEWNAYLNSSPSLRSAGGVLLETATWGQDDPYNRKTPLIGNKHVPVGCVPTAMGILMRYHRFPEQANAAHRVASYYNQSVSYGKYDWGSMPDKLSNSSSNKQIDAVSELLWHAGANAEAKYTEVETRTSMADALSTLRDVFGYSKQMRYLQKIYSDYSWEEWEQLMRDELDDGRPILYASETEECETPLSGIPHAFVCDGYDSYGRYHFNWGWDGKCNGFYILSALDPTNNETWGGFNQDHNMIVNIKPNKDSENQVSLQVCESVQGDGFRMKQSIGMYEDIVTFPIVNAGNIPFNGYLTYVLTDHDGNIKEIGDYDIEISDLVPDNDWYRAEFIVKMSENDYAMAAYSTDRKNWSVIKGTSSEIADKMNLEGPVSNQKVYYAWELDCRNEGLTLEAPEKLEYDKPAEFVLKPNKGYVLPKADDILIQIAGGTVLVNNPGYGSRATVTYDEKTGKLAISCVYGHVHIVAEGVQADDDVDKYKDTSLESLGYTLDGKSNVIDLRYGWESYTVLLPSDKEALPKITLNAVAKQLGAKVEITNPVWIENTAVGKVKVTALNGISCTTYTVAFKRSQSGEEPDIPSDEAMDVTTSANITNVNVKAINMGNTQRRITPTFTQVHTGELNILAETEVGIILSGDDNQLGKIVNNGSLQIFCRYKEGSASCTSFVNNGSVFDITGSITKVEGHAALEIMPITVSTDGGMTVLDGRALGNNVKLSWYKGDDDQDAWTMIEAGKSNGLRATGVNSKLSVSESGVYRLEAEVVDGEYYANLSSFVEVDIDNKESYTVTLPVVEGVVITPENSTTVKAGGDFAFTIQIKEGFSMADMVVKANGIELPVDIDGRCVIKNVQSNVVVTVVGVVEKDPTSIDSVVIDKISVWAANGRLFIQTPVADTAYIIAFDGRVYKTLSLSAGEYSEQMPQGSYIIHVGKRSYKLNF